MTYSATNKPLPLKVVGTEKETVNGITETFIVFHDTRMGGYWTYDPDLTKGKLCSCHFKGKWHKLTWIKHP